MNLVDASTSFRSAESWTPICLPKFNDTGFLHAHVSYLPGDSPACLLLISTDKEKFFALQECQMRIVEVGTLHSNFGVRFWYNYYYVYITCMHVQCMYNYVAASAHVHVSRLKLRLIFWQIWYT